MVERIETKSNANVESQINQLRELKRSELVEAWRKQFKCDPPKGIKRGLLERAVGNKLQANRFGGLKRETRRALEAIATCGKPTEHALPRRRLVACSRLVREWQGQTHYVDVFENGFEWNGRRYKSLSAIAFAITGTKWSGPRFFGLPS